VNVDIEEAKDNHITGFDFVPFLSGYSRE